MNEKDTKVPIYIAIIVAVLLVAVGGYFILGQKEKPTLPPVTPVATPKATPTSTALSGATPPAPTPVPLTPTVTIKCELCHVNPQEFRPHVNGGRYCMNCHGSQVHNIHIGPGTVGLQCETCHGFPPQIPQVLKKGEGGPGSYSVCERCHAPPPNSTKPSYGNIIVVHLSRGKYCTNCHGTDIGAIHAAKLANMTKK